MHARNWLTAAAAGLVCSQAFSAPPAATPDPWAMVPPLSTDCLSGQDKWPEQNNAALEAVQQAHYKQTDINAAIEQKYRDAMNDNPMAMAQAMQQAMMSDPQNAQKYMQRLAQRGQEAQSEVPEKTAKEKELKDEADAVMKQYHAALDRALAPGSARWTALKKKMGLPMDATRPGEMGVPSWAWAEWHGILKEWDKGYVANCAHWWTATGPVHAYLKRYKDYLVQERTPYYRRLIDDPKLEQYKLLNVSTQGWRTTKDYEAAEDYMKMASKMFDQRWAWPRCRGDGECPP
jgi:hypothetical protein